MAGQVAAATGAGQLVVVLWIGDCDAAATVGLADRGADTQSHIYAHRFIG